MNINIDAIKTKLRELCPPARSHQEPFCEILIPKELGGNGETVVYKKTTFLVGYGSKSRHEFDWHVCLYPGQPREHVVQLDEQNYESWKAQKKLSDFIRGKMKK